MDVVTLKKAVKDAGKYTDQEVSALEALFDGSQIVEQGSNDDGYYIKYASGWMVCLLPRQRIELDPPVTSGGETEEFRWSFPQPFLDSTASSYAYPAHVSVTGAMYDEGVTSRRSTEVVIRSGDHGSNFMRANKIDFAFVARSGNNNRLQYTAFAFGRWS